MKKDSHINSLTRRFAIVVLALGFAAAPPDVEANLFKKLKEKRQAKMRAIEAAKKAAETPARPRPRHRSWYRDEHKDAFINDLLLDAEPEAERKIVVDIERQRAFLVVNGLVAVDSAVSTARRNKYTPRGTFRISEKIKTGKVSTLYHVYMPYWMRLGETSVGMHIGDLPGYPASAGCIRLPQSVAPIIYEHAQRGVKVEVVDTWDEEDLRIPYSILKPDFIGV
ncbi:MAG: L,D-transpeptidase [Verrucomicrobiales bacterium]|jgi:lipoprotein-anchoring transpeptidase ErfK/SrfK|nr:L,D-transpeptidase [Verrucomicrobiales bacterium]